MPETLPAVLDYQVSGAGTLRVNVLDRRWSQVGCDYRAGLQRDTWAGSWAGGCVVGEVRQDAQQQAPSAAADPSVCGSESGLNNIYKPPHGDSQESALLLLHTICLTSQAAGTRAAMGALTTDMDVGVSDV